MDGLIAPIKMKQFEDFKNALASLEDDAVKFYEKGNSAAGTRLRAGMQKLKGLAQDIRNDVTAKKNK